MGGEAMPVAGQSRLHLNDGRPVPQLGFGAWRIEDAEAPRIVGAALRAGYRHIDTAQGYGNEAGVGEAIRQADVAREELFITSKLRTRDMGYEKALRSCEASLQRMGLVTLDLFLIHWPLPATNSYVETWKALVELRRQGRVSSIGVSNFLPAHIDRIVGETGVVPAVNQVELHPYYQQRDIRSYHAANAIVIESYSPLGGDDGAVLDNDVIGRIGRKHNKSAAQTIIRWHLQQGLVALPKSATLARIRENAEVFDFRLDDAEMAAIDRLDRRGGKRLPTPDRMHAVF